MVHAWCAEMPAMYKLPCLRWIVTDSSLYREQEMPYQLFSRRWQSMDPVNITESESEEIKIISLSQVAFDAPYTVAVRRFIPQEGDMLVEQWVSDGIPKTHETPQYALADVEAAAVAMEGLVNEQVGIYIREIVGMSDALIWHTYYFAFHHAYKARVSCGALGPLSMLPVLMSSCCRRPWREI